MDFKKLKKSSSKKLIPGGLGFFLSPKEEKKGSNENSNSTKDAMSLFSTKKHNEWDNEDLKLDISKNAEEHGKDYIDDIPVIPSIDDFTCEDITNEIAKAPLIGVKQVATINELENDILKHSAFANLEELNLKVLIKLIHSESSEEPDIPWSRESLFNEIVSHINERKLKC